jgi:hypothetical protein
LHEKKKVEVVEDNEESMKIGLNDVQSFESFVIDCFKIILSQFLNGISNFEMEKGVCKCIIEILCVESLSTSVNSFLLSQHTALLVIDLILTIF